MPKPQAKIGTILDLLQKNPEATRADLAELEAATQPRRPPVIRASTLSERIRDKYYDLFESAARQPIGRIADALGLSDLQGIANERATGGKLVMATAVPPPGKGTLGELGDIVKVVKAQLKGSPGGMTLYRGVTKGGAAHLRGKQGGNIVSSAMDQVGEKGAFFSRDPSIAKMYQQEIMSGLPTDASGIWVTRAGKKDAPPHWMSRMWGESSHIVDIDKQRGKLRFIPTQEAWSSPRGLDAIKRRAEKELTGAADDVRRTVLLRRAKTSYKAIKAGDSLGPFVSGQNVSNMSSIKASLEPGYVIEPELQAVPLSEFYGGKPAPLSYSATEQKRTADLAKLIQSSKRMDPLIVVRDAEGSYVLEGGHRLDASYQLGATHVPALVVREQGIPIPSSAKLKTK